MTTSDHAADGANDLKRLLDRLSRRGKLTITAEDGVLDVQLHAHGPWTHGRCTTDKHDLFDNLRLGAKNWQGEGSDLAALLVLCEMESRPETRDIDTLVWAIEYRRDSRTAGPPLPSYVRWLGWRPGQERWLRTFDHAREYRGGYERDRAEQRRFDAERREAEIRREHRERVRVRTVLEGS